MDDKQDLTPAYYVVIFLLLLGILWITYHDIGRIGDYWHLM